MRNLTSIAIGVGMVAVALIPFQSKAQLASQSTEFSGTVPAVCRVTDAVNSATPMAFVDNVLRGTTNDFSFESNGNVALQLRQVEISAAPDGTGSYQWNAGLKINNGAQLASASQNNASQPVAYPNGLTSNDDFQMTLAISAPQGVMMQQGSYVAVVTTDCVIN